MLCLSHDRTSFEFHDFGFSVSCDVIGYARYPDIDCNGLSCCGNFLEASPTDCALHCDGHSDCSGNTVCKFRKFPS